MARQILLYGLLTILAVPLNVSAQPWQVGDVFLGVGEPQNPTYGGRYFVYSPTGEAKATTLIGSPLRDPARDYTTGCAIDPFTGRFWGTNFNRNQVLPFDSGSATPAAPVIDTTLQIGRGGADPSGTESVQVGIDPEGRHVLYVGTVDSAQSPATQKLLKYSAKAQTVAGVSYTAGQLLAAYDIPRGMRGVDWFDLSSDGKTLYYTSEDGQRDPSGNYSPAQIRVYDLYEKVSRPSIVLRRPDGSTFENIAYGVRVLPPGDGSAGFLVATQLAVMRLDRGGLVIDHYAFGYELGYFGLNFAPDGKSFWTAQFRTGDDKVFRFAINGSALDPRDASKIPQVVIRPHVPVVAGLCVKLEPTALLGCPVLDAQGQPVLANGLPQFRPCPRLEQCTVRGADADGDGLPSDRDPDCLPPPPSNRAPSCGEGGSLGVLWPPNGQLVALTLPAPSDPDGDPLSVNVAVLQDEPTEAEGEGGTVRDAEVNGLLVSVRAERSGTPRVAGNGRVYTITLEATDSAGAACRTAWTATVPHNIGSLAVDDSEQILYDSVTGAQIR